MKWRIFYEDGTTSDTLGRAYGVICVVENDEKNGRKIPNGYDYYLLVDGSWMGADRDSLFYYLTQQLHRVGAVLVGVMVHHQVFEKIYKQARDDPDFSPKTSRYTCETKRASRGRVD